MNLNIFSTLFLFQYNALYNDFQHFEGTIGRLDNNIQLITELYSALTNNSLITNQTKNLLSRGLTWTHSLNKFVSTLEVYTLYQDLTTTSISSLKSLQNGVSILLDKLRSSIQNERFIKKSLLNPAQFCTTLLDTIRMTPEEAHAKIVEPTFFNTSKFLATTCDQRSLSSLSHNALAIALQCLQNHFKSNLNVYVLSDFRKTALALFRSTMSAFYQLWCNRKQYELEEEARKASLYKYKSQVHCENKTEEESSAETMQNLFPTYDADYDDVIPRDILNEAKRQPDVNDEETDSYESQSSPIVDENLVYGAMRGIFLKSDSVEQKELLGGVFHQVWKLLKVPEVVYGEFHMYFYTMYNTVLYNV